MSNENRRTRGDFNRGQRSSELDRRVPPNGGDRYQDDFAGGPNQSEQQSAFGPRGAQQGGYGRDRAQQAAYAQGPRHQGGGQFNDYPQGTYQQGGQGVRRPGAYEQAPLRRDEFARDWGHDYPNHERHQHADDQHTRGDFARSEPRHFEGRGLEEPARDWGTDARWGQDSRAYAHQQDIRGYAHQDEYPSQSQNPVRRALEAVKRPFRAPKGYVRTDDRIREDVCERLAHSEDVDPTDVEVRVQNGEVTLTGTVLSRRMKYVAEDTADSVSGVSDVHNQLRVKREGATEPRSEGTPRAR